MIDQITLNRIKLLHPKLVEEVEGIYLNEIVPALSSDVYCRFAYTMRTFPEQDVLYAQGRTKLFDNAGHRLGIVTNARAGQSYHNYGLALDIVLINGAAASWDNVKDYDGDGMADWTEVANIFIAHGWTWGKSFGDSPHFEKTFKNHWSVLLDKYNQKDFIPGTTYVNI